MAVTPTSYDNSLQGVGYGLDAASRVAGSVLPKTQTSAKTASAGRTDTTAKESAKKASTDGSDSESSTKSSEKATENKTQPGELTPEEQQLVSELKIRDREVRAHEQAHISVGGPYIRGSSFQYQTGPDGRRYAVGGEVGIDTSPEKEPERTIAKMEVVKRAALAPKDPSAQDRSVAATASERELEAQLELAEMAVEKAKAAAQEKSAERSEAKSAAQTPAPAKHGLYDNDDAAPDSAKIDIYA